MLNKPDLPDDQIIACLRASYGLDASELEFLPLGYDNYAAVYRARADGQDYFVKLKSDAVNPLSVVLPRWLNDHGLGEVIAPMPTTHGDLWGSVGQFTLLLYPFIDEDGDAHLSDRQWVALGDFLKRLHAASLPPHLADQMPKENFIPHPGWAAILRRLQAEVGSRACADPVEREAARFWNERRQEIDLIAERADRLGRMLQGRPVDFVLCHADIHLGNLMLDRQARLFVVDWDQPVLAPRERDLMFVTVGSFQSDPATEALFFEGYGKTDIDPLVMGYYRYERVMEDIAGFGEMIFLMDSSDETKRDSLEWLGRIFGPGGDVEVAHRLDHALGL